MTEQIPSFTGQENPSPEDGMENYDPAIGDPVTVLRGNGKLEPGWSVVAKQQAEEGGAVNFRVASVDPQTGETRIKGATGAELLDWKTMHEEEKRRVSLLATDRPVANQIGRSAVRVVVGRGLLRKPEQR